MRLIVKGFCSSTDETVPSCATVTGAACGTWQDVKAFLAIQAQMARDNAQQQGSPGLSTVSNKGGASCGAHLAIHRAGRTKIWPG